MQKQILGFLCLLISQGVFAQTGILAGTYKNNDGCQVVVEQPSRSSNAIPITARGPKGDEIPVAVELGDSHMYSPCLISNIKDKEFSRQESGPNIKLKWACKNEQWDERLTVVITKQGELVSLKLLDRETASTSQTKFVPGESRDISNINCKNLVKTQ